MLSDLKREREFAFFFGAASGSARKALRKLDEPNVMINYATKNNKPWYGIENLFIDSGGYSFIKGRGEYETSDEKYAEWLLDVNPGVFALRDYPCEPDVLDEHDRTVGEHQRRTTERHYNLWSMVDDVDGQRLSVLQGWSADQYLEHLDGLRDYGVLAEYVGIGSVCRRDRENEIREIILAVRDALPPKYKLHAFGVKGSVLQFPDVRRALSSADSQSYEMQARWGTLHDLDTGSRTWRDSALEYLRQKRRVRVALAGKNDADTEQQTLLAATDGGNAHRIQSGARPGEKR